jgi:hypothetical protein
VYCGIARGHCTTSRHSGDAAPSSAASSRSTAVTISSGVARASAGLRAPPTNVVSSTVSSGARPSNMLLEKSVPRIALPSARGERKPKPSSACFTSARR